MKLSTKISIALVAIGAVLIIGAPSVAAAAWTPPPAEQEPALPAEGVEALTWTEDGWTLSLEAGAWEAKVIEPAQEILCGSNYGNPCGVTYRLSSTATCVMVQVDWADGRHNSTDPWRCKPEAPTPSPSASPSTTSSPTPSETSQPSATPSSSPSLPSTPTPSASPETTPSPESPSSSPTPTSTPSPEASTSTPSTPTSTPATTASPSSSAPVASAPEPSVPRSSELARTGGPNVGTAISLGLVLIVSALLILLVVRGGNRR